MVAPTSAEMQKTMRTLELEPNISGPPKEELSKFFGGYVEGVIPDPIPNSEVKPFRADGTARGTVWESRTPPELILEAPARESWGFLFPSRQHGRRGRALRPHAGREAGDSALRGSFPGALYTLPEV